MKNLEKWEHHGIYGWFWGWFLGWKWGMPKSSPSLWGLNHPQMIGLVSWGLPR